MTIKFDDVRMWAFSASLEEMNQIGEVFKLRRNQIGITTAMSFKENDPVWIDGGRRGIIHGKFIKMSRKNATVMANDGMKWTVSPHLLHKP